MSPLWLSLDLGRRGPLAMFVLGSTLYLASWVPPLIGSSVARHRIVYLSPYVTPLVWLLALAWMGDSWMFAATSLIFVVVHAAHGVFAHRKLSTGSNDPDGADR